MGIHYKIRTQKNNLYSSKLFRKTPQLNEEEDNFQTQKPEEEAQRCRGVRRVLKDVNLQAKPREILATVGPSGAGKSSLLEILAGIARSWREMKSRLR
ncbi:hypothetical protein K1719_015114 [Acacia pycnantha]|nr:hypothetical protein K1719_015114 [Acacia pycnantha]